MARAEPSTTWAALPASRLTDPVTVTFPAGGAGTCEGSVNPWLPVATQPRSTRSAVPDAVTSGTTTSTPEAPCSSVWYRMITVFATSYVPVAETTAYCWDGSGSWPTRSARSTGTGGAFSLVRMIALVVFLDSRRCHCHRPSSRQAYASKSTTTRNRSQRRLRRNRRLPTVRGYPALGD